jgi:hypothetical protein
MSVRKQARGQKEFNPRHRWEAAMCIVKQQLVDDPRLQDPWVAKIVGMLQLRAKFREEYGATGDSKFECRYPLYASLLTAVEDTTTGGDRDMLEAALLCSADLAAIHGSWRHPRFDSLFLGAYRRLFFDVVPMMQDPGLVFQHILAPMVAADSDKLAIGHIWKILALAGGFSLLKRKGFGSEPIKAEDIERLLQLASFRHCSSILQYTAAGTKFFAENPAAMMSINALTAFDGIRSSRRRPDYIAELDSVAKNNFNTLLQSELKLLSVPDEAIRKLVEFDGQFRPEAGVDVIETCEHVTFINNEDTQDQDE